MCGIAGIFELRPEARERRELLDTMLQRIAHRGPDAQGTVHFPEACLGHVRLSIIDLAHGQQPMGCSEGRYWLSYNGEVFNYIELKEELEKLGQVFHTHSDTEVVLKSLVLWGPTALSKFNGQFALAWLDRQEKTVLLARDPFGERPLFYAKHSEAFSIASEIKGLLSLPWLSREFDMEALHSIAGSWTLQPSQTCFKGIHQLPPGHWMRIPLGQGEPNLKAIPYYQLPTMDEENISLDTVREALDKSVRLRLRSDVPVGTYLSGGLDSSIITALTCQHKENVRSFSVSFSDPAYDEQREQQLASRHLGTKHIELRINEADIANAFPDAVAHAECGQFRTALTPLYLLAQQVRKEGLKVVLTGEGADEFWLGYNIYKETLFRLQLPQLDDDAAALQLSKLYPYLPHFQAEHARQQLPLFRKALGGSDLLFSHQMRLNTSSWSESFLAPSTQSAQQQWIDTLGKWPGFSERDVLGKAQELERLSLLHGYLLSSQGDRMAMAHGVEARCPFLDPEVVALAQRCKQESKLEAGHNEKAILKKAFAGLLPTEIYTRSKQPYRAMEASCFVKTQPEWFREVSDPAYLAKREWLNGKKAAQLFSKIAESEGNISPRENQTVILLCSLLVLENQPIRHHY
jgi:asparagine synthase (glutamine-hydrolysing)